MTRRNRFLKKLISTQRSPCLLCNQPHDPAQTTKYKELEICPRCFAQIHFLKEPLCEGCGREMSGSEVELCKDCIEWRGRNGLHYAFRNRSAVAYSPLVREWIYTYKYQRRQRLGHGLSELLYIAYLQHYAHTHFDVITFVPLHPNRIKERGFNQAEQLAYSLSKRIGHVMRPTLTRIIDTPKQSQQQGWERRKQLAGAFNAIGASGKSILIIDDIYTTGATLHQCAQVLCEHGWEEVYTLTIARS